MKGAHHFHFWEYHLAGFYRIHTKSEYSTIQTGFQFFGMNGVFNIYFEGSTVDERLQLIMFDEGRILHNFVGFYEYTKISGYFSS